MAWTTLTDAQLAANSPGTQAKFRALRDNPIAIANGDAGAPRVQTAGLEQGAGVQAATQATIRNAAVGQAQLRTTTAAGSVAVAANSDGSFTLTGGTYSWWTASGGTPSGLSFGGNVDTAAGVIGLYNFSSNSRTFFVDERFVQASPPYRRLFYGFLAVDGLGRIQHCSFAPDPPWAYHGPTDITPQYSRKGKDYRRVLMLGGVPLAVAMQDPALLRQYLDGAPTEETEIEITPEYKDSDMGVVPHPFLGADLTGLTVVQIDGPMMVRLAEMCDLGHAHEVRKLFLGGDLRIDNTPLPGLVTPPGVMAVAARWKLTP